MLDIDPNSALNPAPKVDPTVRPRYGGRKGPPRNFLHPATPPQAMPKNLSVSQDIIPLGDFKLHLSQYLHQLRDTGRPLIITQNGRPAAVLLTPEEFDRLSAQDPHPEERRATVRQHPPVSEADLTRFEDE